MHDSIFPRSFRSGPTSFFGTDKVLNDRALTSINNSKRGRDLDAFHLESLSKRLKLSDSFPMGVPTLGAGTLPTLFKFPDVLHSPIPHTLQEASTYVPKQNLVSSRIILKLRI